MDFWGADTVVYNNFRLERVGTWEEYKTIQSKISRERAHYQTGQLIIDAPDTARDVDEARKYAWDSIAQLHLLLAFAHGHDVPIHELIFEEVADGQTTQRGHEISATWFGKPGAHSFNIRSSYLGSFLETTMPLLECESFVSETAINQALMFYNLAVNSIFLEVKFAILWLGLETMANSFYEQNQEDLVLTRTEWNDLKDRISSYLTEIEKKDVYTNLLQKISFLREGTIKERIAYMLGSSRYQMGQYVSEVDYMYDEMRVPFFHGRQVDWLSNSKRVFRLKRLMEKLILKTLNFYENVGTCYSIRDDDLSKR